MPSANVQGVFIRVTFIFIGIFTYKELLTYKEFKH